MNDLVVCPRIVSGLFLLSITSLEKFKIWFQIEQGPLFPGAVSHSTVYQYATSGSTGIPANASIIVETSDKLTLKINRDLPPYVQDHDHAVQMSFRHQYSFKAEEQQEGRLVVHFALPFIERSEYVLELAMRPGQSVKITGKDFEQTVNVR